MKHNITVTLQDVTEQDIRDIFHSAIEQLGVRAGDQIPADMYNLREKVISALFNPPRQGLTVEEINSYFKSGV